jgi:hypothetical protein
MEGPLYRMLILCRSVNKQGRHRQFLFLIGRFLKIFSSSLKTIIFSAHHFALLHSKFQVTGVNKSEGQTY